MSVVFEVELDCERVMSLLHIMDKGAAMGDVAAERSLGLALTRLAEALSDEQRPSAIVDTDTDADLVAR